MAGIRRGLIGATDTARARMIPAFRQAGDHLVSVMSSSEDLARSIAGENCIPVHISNLNILLQSDIDVIYISTTNELHLTQALVAIRGGDDDLWSLSTGLAAKESRKSGHLIEIRI